MTTTQNILTKAKKTIKMMKKKPLNLRGFLFKKNPLKQRISIFFHRKEGKVRKNVGVCNKLWSIYNVYIIYTIFSKKVTCKIKVNIS